MFPHTSKHTQPQNNTTSIEKLAGWARHHVAQSAGHTGAAGAGAQAVVIRHRPGRGGCGASVAAATPHSEGARSILFLPQDRTTPKFDASYTVVLARVPRASRESLFLPLDHTSRAVPGVTRHNPGLTVH